MRATRGVLPGVLLLLAAAYPAGARSALVCERVLVTPKLPLRGQRAVLHVAVRNTGLTPLRNARVRFTVRIGAGAVERLPESRLGELSPGATASATTEWIPRRNGWATLTGEAQADGQAAVPAPTLRAPVIERPVYFAWFGIPVGLHYANLSTTAGPGQTKELLQRGIFPWAWEGGVCNKDWPLERFVESWSDAALGIAIDEFGGDPAMRARLMDATRLVHRKRPDLFIAWWGIGSFSPEEYRTLAPDTNLFLPEIYLNYHAFHLGAIERAIRLARQGGALGKTVIGLGINDKEHGAPNTPTPAQVEAQVEMIKRLAPEMPGLGFFNFDGAPPAVRRRCDELCAEYFINPVLTLSGAPRLERSGRMLALAAVVRNTGNMDSPAGWLRVLSADSGRALARQRFASIAAGKALTVRVALTHTIPQNNEKKLRSGTRRGFPAPSGPETLRAEVEPAPGVTRLAAAGEVVVPAAQRGVLAVPPSPSGERVLWVAPPATLKASEALSVLRVRPAGSGGFAPAQWDPEWSRAGGAAIWVQRESQLRPAYCRLVARPGSRAATAKAPRGRWEFSNALYRAVLDLDADQLLELVPAGSRLNLLKTPWQARLPGTRSFGPATVTVGPVFTRVRMPFTTDLAEGLTDYTFFRDLAAIRCRREYRPRRPHEVTDAAEGASLEQRGGAFQCQAGAEGEVQRGQLWDGDRYRDLLFGFLGWAPGPDNSERAGWFDFSWGKEENAGLGVAIERRWRSAGSRVGYDVTRYYDAADWIEVPMVWGGTPVTVREPQESCVWLLPHGYRELQRAAVSPVGAFLEALRCGQPRKAE